MGGSEIRKGEAECCYEKEEKPVEDAEGFPEISVVPAPFDYNYAEKDVEELVPGFRAVSMAVEIPD